jgi:putative CRISPR-associated protein (TIGR02619 family)
MRRVVISTIGTSLLTNQSESHERFSLTNEANRKDENISSEVKSLILKLKEKADIKLNGTVEEVRKASAELNGIYGLYEGKLEQGTEKGKQDLHFLIATDTAQGQLTAQIVQSFLEKKGFIVGIPHLEKLSTVSTENFTNGVTELIKWIDLTLPEYKKNGYKIYFNLVGGFKSLQAYLNTIGMFYADEIIYIFEGKNSEVITIPQLPIEVDKSAIEPIAFALMAQGAWVKSSQLQGVPEKLLFKVEDEATLDPWGLLIWNKCKDEILAGELLTFTNLKYSSSFTNDCSKIKGDERVKLQETLAKTSSLLTKHNGDTGALKQDGGLLYEVYQNQGGIAHFRITQGIRVSCTGSGGVLTLRRYGKEPDVNKNP